MIAFRFPYILFFFLIFLLLLIIWVKGERTHNKVWIKMTPDLKEKLFSRLDINPVSYTHLRAHETLRSLGGRVRI